MNPGLQALGGGGARGEGRYSIQVLSSPGEPKRLAGVRRWVRGSEWHLHPLTGSAGLFWVQTVCVCVSLV
jgi:hypothetical protein